MGRLRLKAGNDLLKSQSVGAGCRHRPSNSLSKMRVGGGAGEAPA